MSSFHSPSKDPEDSLKKALDSFSSISIQQKTPLAAELNTEISEKDTQIAVLQTRCTNLSEEAKLMRQKIFDLQAREAEIQDSFAKVEKDLGVRVESEALLLERISTVEAEREVEVSIIKANLESSGEQISRVQMELSEASIAVKSLEQEVALVKSEKMELVEKLEAIAMEKQQIILASNEKESHVAELLLKIDTLESNLKSTNSSLSKTIHELRDSLLAAEKSIVQKEDEIHFFRSESSNIKQELLVVQTHLQDKQFELGAVTEKLNSVLLENESLAVKLLQSDSNLSNLKQQADILETELTLSKAEKADLEDIAIRDLAASEERLGSVVEERNRLVLELQEVKASKEDLQFRFQESMQKNAAVVESAELQLNLLRGEKDTFLAASSARVVDLEKILEEKTADLHRFQKLVVDLETQLGDQTGQFEIIQNESGLKFNALKEEKESFELANSARVVELEKLVGEKERELDRSIKQISDEREAAIEKIKQDNDSQICALQEEKESAILEIKRTMGSKVQALNDQISILQANLDSDAKLLQEDYYVKLTKSETSVVEALEKVNVKEQLIIQLESKVADLHLKLEVASSALRLKEDEIAIKVEQMEKDLKEKSEQIVNMRKLSFIILQHLKSLALESLHVKEQDSRVAITEKLESQLQVQSEEVCTLRAKVQELEDANLSQRTSFESEKASWMERLKEMEDESSILKLEIKRLQVQQNLFPMGLLRIIFLGAF